MKRMIYVLMAVFTFLSCNATEKKDGVNTNDTTQSGKTENKVTTIHLTKAEFLQKVANIDSISKEWKYLGDKPCIVDFYATWCGPCKQIAPILEELAAEYSGKIYIYKVDVDKEPLLAAAFRIQSIPALLFVPMEGNPQMGKGAMPKEGFEKAIKEVLLVE